MPRNATRPAPNQRRPAPPGSKRPTRTQGVDLEAVLISKKQLYLIVGALVLGLGGGAAWLFLLGPREPADIARREIAEAKDLQVRAATSPNLAEHRAVFDEGQALLEASRGRFDEEEWEVASATAVEAQGRFKRVINERGAVEDGSFREVDGGVEVQRRSGGTWDSARVRMPLFDGDWVKTGVDGTAEILYANGDRHEIRPDTMFEFVRREDPSTKQAKTEIELKTGEIKISSSEEETIIRTPRQSRIVIAPDTEGQARIDPKNNTGGVEIYRGSATITTPSGEQIAIADRKAVFETAEGGLGPVRDLPNPPDLLGPAADASFDLRETSQVDLAWSAVKKADSYRLQVSRSRFFVAPEVDKIRDRTNASLKILSRGSYFWRVATISSDGKTDVQSEWSPVRRFRFRSPELDDALEPGEPTAEPPSLTIDGKQAIGSQLLLQGSTDPGATVTVDGETASVDSQGRWTKLHSLKTVGINVIKVTASQGGVETTEMVHYLYSEN